MKIGVAAKELGITSSTIRFYERKGLIRPIGRVSGRRELDENTLHTLKFLKFAKSAGFQLSEVTTLLEIGFGDQRETKEWTDFLSKKRTELAQRIEDLRRMHDLLGQFEKCECVDLKDCMSAPQSPHSAVGEHD